MSDEQNPNAKRAAKRYPYIHLGSCWTDQENYEIRLFNISSTGIQFSSKQEIETRDEVSIVWKDEHLGNFDVTFVIKRKIESDPRKEYPVTYGAQYFKLTEKMKLKLTELLKRCRSEDKKGVQDNFEKLSPKAIYAIIEQGDEFLHQALVNKIVPEHFAGLIDEIKDYEKAAFFEDNDYAFCLRRLVLHYFHCNMLGMMVHFISGQSELKSSFFDQVLFKIQKTTEVDPLVEDTIMKVSLGRQSDEEKDELIRKINETSNRFFYTKEGLLKSMVETFSYIDLEVDELKVNLSLIKQEYEKILELTNASFQEAVPTYKRRSKKPEEYSRAEVIMDASVLEYKRPNYLMWASSAVIFTVILVYGSSKLMDHQQKSKMTHQIGIDIDPIKYERIGGQMSLTFSSSEWASLPKQHKEHTIRKIYNYIREDRNIRTCMIYDDKMNVIKILYDEMILPPPSE
jgi:hypothetical protein